MIWRWPFFHFGAPKWHQNNFAAKRIERSKDIPKKNARRISFRRFWRTHSGDPLKFSRRVRRRSAREMWSIMR